MTISTVGVSCSAMQRFSCLSLVATVLTSSVLSGLAPALALPPVPSTEAPPPPVQSMPTQPIPAQTENNPPAATELPPAEDIPEEVLRTEITTEMRSPRTGEPLTAAEFAEFQAQQDAQPDSIGFVPPNIRRLITLLRIRKGLRTIFPFIP